MGKDPHARKDRRQKEKRVPDDQMVREHHSFRGHESSKLQEIVKDREACHASSMKSKIVGHSLVTER